MNYNKNVSEMNVEEKISSSSNMCMPKNVSNKSACTVSFINTNSNLKHILQNKEDKHPYNYKYDDIKELEEAYNDFILLCLNNSLYPTMELLACYLNVSSDWLTRVYNNKNDKRCTTIKRVREIIKAILTQHALTKEGNPAGNIFHLKATFGMSENNVITLQSGNTNYDSLTSEQRNEILNALEESN